MFLHKYYLLYTFNACNIALRYYAKIIRTATLKDIYYNYLKYIKGVKIILYSDH